MVDRWRCAEAWCAARWTGAPEAGYPHPPMPDDSCPGCGEDTLRNDPHAPGGPDDREAVTT